MADRNRGGRSRDDDPIENEDEFEAELDEEFDEDGYDDDEPLDDDAEEKPAAKRGAGSRARTVERARTKKDTASVGFFGRIINFIREMFAELQKVIWPTRRELLTYTTVVIVFVAIMMTFVSLLDVGFARLMFLVFGSTETPAATE